jgi:hypothetical protein
MPATLRQKKWLLREWEVTTPAGVFVVTYSGRGHGYESVRVNGEVVAKKKGFAWFVPSFEFRQARFFGKNVTTIKVKRPSP